MIRLYFGLPGCGKTTTAVRELYKLKELPFYKKYYNEFAVNINCLLKKDILPKFKDKKQFYDFYFSNFDNDLSRKISLKDIGLWTLPENSYLSIDEASIEYNNRKFKSLPQHTIEWLKLHRHYKIKNIDLFSQSWDDVDVTWRRIVDEIWYVKKLGPFTMLRRIYKSIRIDKNTEQIIDGYRFDKLLMSLLNFILGLPSIKIYWRRPYYRYFDSWERPNLPIKYGGDIND